MKYFLFFLLCPMVLFAQEAVEVTPFPWQENALVVLIVTTSLGILSSLVHKIPGTAGTVITWLVDLFSANVKHK